MKRRTYRAKRTPELESAAEPWAFFNLAIVVFAIVLFAEARSKH